MKNMKLLFSSLITTSILTFAGSIYAQEDATSASVGVIEVLEGAAKITRETTFSASEGVQVYEGDTLSVDSDSHLKIVFIDENELDLQQNSKIKIESYMFDSEKNERTSLFELLLGQVRSTVKQKYDGEKSKYQIRTNVAVAAVRGTDFLVDYNKNSDDIEVTSFEGEVDVGAKQSNGQFGGFQRIKPGFFLQGGLRGFKPIGRMPEARFKMLEQGSRRPPNMMRRQEFQRQSPIRPGGGFGGAKFDMNHMRGERQKPGGPGGEGGMRNGQRPQGGQVSGPGDFRRDNIHNNENGPGPMGGPKQQHDNFQRPPGMQQMQQPGQQGRPSGQQPGRPFQERSHGGPPRRR
jgi:hypothetical protein